EYDRILGLENNGPADPEPTIPKQTDPAYEHDFGDEEGDPLDPEAPADADDDETGLADEETGLYDDDDEPAAADEADDDYEPIDPEEVAAGRAAGLDDQTIIQLAETSPQVLQKLARARASAPIPAQKPEEPAGPQEPTETLSALKKLALTAESLDDPQALETIQGTINGLVETVEKLSGKLAEHETGIQQSRKLAAAEQTRRIDSYFDTVSKEVPLLGHSKKLDQTAIDARLFAAAVARGAQQAFGGKLSDEEALAIGVSALKGQFTEQQVKSRIVSDLHRHRKKFTARPRGQKRATGSRPEMERAMEVMEQKFREFGL
ncbi:MAG: hypothetical protein M0Q27_03470, partial [Candidatus Colwellbacteria bacterium]|nr:hypothetical protein [Candidatus Colwellbacteria bacterium]